MKNEYTLLFLISSLLIAVNTKWSVPSKVLVVISSLMLIASAVKELSKDEH